MSINRLLLLMLVVAGISRLEARNPDYRVSSPAPVSYRAECTNSLSSIDQEINNVRARLLGGGDCWWDFSDGRYIVPKVDPSTGAREVSSIFAGSVWLGGVDPAGNLKLACQDYRNDGRNDFWPGPLDVAGITEGDRCKQWDRHFRVLGSEVREHLKAFKAGSYDESQIPQGLKEWPAKGNPFFNKEIGFPLPSTPQGLGSFFDENEDGEYNPLDGDYPSIEIRGCPLENFPDEMIFWIYNDQGAGAPHARTGGRAIQMEVQVQAFGYQTADELNDMTFQRYKLINRATESIDSTFFAFWCDPDLGCSDDDYIGCDSLRSLMYVYNQDAVDGNPGTSCTGGVATYGNEVPVLGIDYFRGPLDENGEELGMSTFMYMNRAGSGPHPAPTTDAAQPAEYYNYLTSHWKDNTPITFGGSGYNPGSPAAPINYCFPSVPTDAAGWSMCTANLPIGDRRTLQASGPFLLQPGAINELIIGVPWVPNVGGNCPDISRLFRADDLAQGLFDNCFEILNGPPNPPLNWVELNREVVAIIDDYAASEYEYDAKMETDFLAPITVSDSAKAFKFQGYRVYQLINANVSASDYDDVSKAREVLTLDLKDNITTIYNWERIEDPDGDEYFIPEQQVVGKNSGIKHTFSFKDDAFATGNDKQLINHRQYYYSIVAYAYNNYEKFEPFPNGAGQFRPYLPGRLDIKQYTVIPRPSIDGALQAAYGDGVPITRLEGVGVGGNEVDWNEDTRAKALSADLKGLLTYKNGKGPITITIFNPYEVKDGNFELRLKDSNMTDSLIGQDARWELVNTDNGEVVLAESTIFQLNEQVVEKYGFSITMTQTDEPGNNTTIANGAIGVDFEYADPSDIWLFGVPDGEAGIFNFIKTEDFAVDQPLDLNQSLTRIDDGFMVPYVLCDWRHGAGSRLITPAWMESTNALNFAAIGNTDVRRRALNALPNVDIVLTSDKSKWSRCVVVETANFYYTGAAYPKDTSLRPQGPNEANPDPSKWRKMFDTRWQPSVGTDGKPDNSGTFGMSYFPGYAVDVETGRRLNIFFGENSCYKSDLNPEYTGRDLLFNPGSIILKPNVQPNNAEYYDLVLGGQHMIYVTNETYDECAEIYKNFSPEVSPGPSAKRTAIKKITWAGLLTKFPLSSLRSVDQGIVPNETRIKVRVDNAYQVAKNPDAPGTSNNGHPRYSFSLNGQGRRDLSGVEVDNALDSIKVVPNPYYGFSQYENNQFVNTVKITNLPAKCTVNIYSIDGKFIRTYNRDEVYQPYQQITGALDWDMKNSKGIPISSGVYIIHVDSPQGKRSIKWFGINRRFDPNGL